MEHHEATGHVTYVEWCQHCVSGRRQSSHHKRHRSRCGENAVPAICLDCCFLEVSARDAPGQEGVHDSVMKTMVVTGHHSGAKMVRNVKTKGIGDGKICKVIFEWLQELAYG